MMFTPEIEKRFVTKAAKTMFVLQWVDWEESHGRFHSGRDFMADAPAALPEAFRNEAWKFLGALEEVNGCSLVIILDRIKKAEDYDSIDNVDIEDFAYCAVMQSVGHGVSWFDDHEKIELKLPDLWQLLELDEDQYPPAPEKPE